VGPAVPTEKTETGNRILDMAVQLYGSVLTPGDKKKWEKNHEKKKKKKSKLMIAKAL